MLSRDAYHAQLGGASECLPWQRQRGPDGVDFDRIATAIVTH
jgi:hypothetical protein